MHWPVVANYYFEELPRAWVHRQTSSVSVVKDRAEGCETNEQPQKHDQCYRNEVSTCPRVPASTRRKGRTQNRIQKFARFPACRRNSPLRSYCCTAHHWDDVDSYSTHIDIGPTLSLELGLHFRHPMNIWELRPSHCGSISLSDTRNNPVVVPKAYN